MPKGWKSCQRLKIPKIPVKFSTFLVKFWPFLVNFGPFCCFYRLECVKSLKNCVKSFKNRRLFSTFSTFSGIFRSFGKIFSIFLQNFWQSKVGIIFGRFLTVDNFWLSTFDFCEMLKISGKCTALEYTSEKSSVSQLVIRSTFVCYCICNFFGMLKNDFLSLKVSKKSINFSLSPILLWVFRQTFLLW